MRMIRTVCANIFVWCAVFAVLPSIAVASLKDDIKEQRQQIGLGAGYITDPSSPIILVTRIVNGLLQLVSIIFFGLVVYGGFLWMTAGSEETKVTKAKETFSRALIGLVVTLAAFAISAFVLSRVRTATSG